MMRDRLCAATGHQNFIARLNSFRLHGYYCFCGMFVADRRFWRWHDRWVTVRWWPFFQWKRLMCATDHHDWVPEGLYDPTTQVPCYHCSTTRG